MFDQRRTLLAGAGAQAGRSSLPWGLTLLGGQRALQLGSRLWLPSGLALCTPRAQAEPFTLMALFIVGLTVGATRQRADELRRREAWMQRPVRAGEDLHDRYSADHVLTPPYRSLETLPGGVTLDSRPDGRTQIDSPLNRGPFRKDINPGELAALADGGALPPNGVVFPKTERLPPPSNDAARHLQEAWRLMAGAQPEKMGYVREFAARDGSTWLVSQASLRTRGRQTADYTIAGKVSAA